MKFKDIIKEQVDMRTIKRNITTTMNAAGKDVESTIATLEREIVALKNDVEEEKKKNEGLEQRIRELSSPQQKAIGQQAQQPVIKTDRVKNVTPF